MPAIVSDWGLYPVPGESARGCARLPQVEPSIIVGLMKSKQRQWLSGTATSALPIAGLIAMLLALAILQLRWSARVSEAERARLQQNLRRSTIGFQSAFALDLLGVCQTLQASQPHHPPTLIDNVADRYMVWRRISRHAALVGGLYIWHQSGETDALLKFNPQNRQLEPAAWPEPIRAFANRARTGTAGLPKRPRAWLWDERVPALIHPIYALGKDGNAAHPQFFGYLFVVFNPQDFEQAYLPDLGRRYFPLSNGFVFQLIEQDGADRSGAAVRRVVYQSDSPKRAILFPHADTVIPLFESATPYRATSSEARGGAASAPVYLFVSDSTKWQIAVRHRSGSVDAAVMGLRRRDLAVSIVVLVMLLASLVAVLAATRRARRLARQQMEFASGVSHELRTPLAVISSAAENLADGVVTEGERIRDYGALIHRESQRLSGMVDHILDFAELESETHRYPRESAAVKDIVQAVLAGERPSIEAAGVSVEMKIPDGVPSLMTNTSVLQQCLQNLVSNALKYGGGGRILVAVDCAREDGEERVLICVRDFGTGIAPEDLSHIYEPFYRASSARDAQIRGTGLGLSLTRKMIEGLGGRITVESSPGKGSAFTLHVPAADSYRLGDPAREAAHSA